ncbi:MAG: hypothetical protein KAT70_02505, partial [Thermoplasmata archaeon]|nr:hypothetical protein [Thermoplasmata archaeon]
DLIVLDTDLSTDPGIETYPGTKATARVYDDVNDRWIADFGGEASLPSWAYFDYKGPRTGFTDESKFKLELDHVITSSSPPIPCYGFVGLHSDPISPDPPDADDRNFMGYRLKWPDPGTSDIKFRAYIWDKDGIVQSGVSVVSDSVLTNWAHRIIISYDPATRVLTVEIRKLSDLSLIGTSTVTLPSDKSLDPMFKIAVRDGIVDQPYQLFGYIDDIKLTWQDIPDEWLLHVIDEGVVILDHVGVHNRDQNEIETIQNALGRDWASSYHDGAGPLFIPMDGILERDSIDQLDRIEDLMVPTKAQGKIVKLISPYRNYTLDDAKVLAWTFPRDLGRPQNRDFFLTVKSRRSPQLS